MHQPFKFSNRRGFTLVEIMLVVLIIGILLGLAVPNYITARSNAQKKSCVKNLSNIEAAKAQYALAEKKPETEAVNWDNLVPDYIKREPECPATGTYDPKTIGESTTCTISDHEAP